MMTNDEMDAEIVSMAQRLREAEAKYGIRLQDVLVEATVTVVSSGLGSAPRLLAAAAALGGMAMARYAPRPESVSQSA